MGKRELDQFRRPLAERLEETRTFIEQVLAAGPEGMSDTFNEEAFQRNTRPRCPPVFRGATGIRLKEALSTGNRRSDTGAERRGFGCG
ncbi:hypothetical protein [Streptosporangium roseum]|uniref:hypothetical protein n=1 Tax=Streptosporangium roseum TaxID=2001 RepID=UPI0033270E17